MSVFNPVVTPNFAAAQPRSPISRLQGNAPAPVGSGSPPGGGGTYDWTEDWSTTPGAEWLSDPTGAVGAWNGSKFGTGGDPLTSALEATYGSTGGIDNDGYVRITNPSPAFANQSTARFTDSWGGLHGNHRFRNGSLRAFTRYSGSPYFFLSGTGKMEYLQTFSNALTFALTDLSGHQTFTCNTGWTLNSSTGNFEGTGTTSLTIPADTVMLADVGEQANPVGRHNCLLVVSYDSGTGAIVLAAPGVEGGGQPGYNDIPLNGDTFQVGPIRGEAITINGDAADIMNISHEGTFEINPINNTTVYTGTPTVVTQTSGITITCGIGTSGKRFERNIYNNGNNGSSELHTDGYVGANNEQLIIGGWFNFNNGIENMGPNSPFNLNQNTNYLYWNDHTDEWICVEQVMNLETNPWTYKVYVTTAWGFANLTSGTAGDRPGSSSIDGGLIAHFHDYLLYSFEYPAAAFTITDSGNPSNSYTGLGIEWGSYWGNTLDTSGAVWQDHGGFDVHSTKIGVADITSM